MPLLIDSAASPRAKARLCLAAIAVMLCGLWGAANAAESDARLRDAVRSLRSQVEMLQQQVSDETAHSEALRERAEQSAADARELARENEALRQTAGQSTTQLRDLQQRIAAQNAQLGQLAAENGRARMLLDQWQTAYDAVLEQARKVDAERHDFAQQAANYRAKADSVQAENAVCTEKNAKLYEIGLDLIAQYKNKGFGSILGDSEPFLQLSRAKLQNLMQSYEDRLYDQKAGVAPPANAAGESLPDGGNEK